MTAENATGSRRVLRRTRHAHPAPIAASKTARSGRTRSTPLVTTDHRPREKSSESLSSVHASPLVQPCRAAAAEGFADTIYIDGRIYTVDRERPWAEAVAIENGRFTAVGSTDEIKAHQGRTPQ